MKNKLILLAFFGLLIVDLIGGGEAHSSGLTSSLSSGGGGGGGGGVSRVVTTTSGATTAAAAASTDYVLFVPDAGPITIPTAAGNSNRYTIKRVGNSTVTINFTGGQTADGSSTLTLPVKYTAVDLVSDGTNWDIL